MASLARYYTTAVMSEVPGLIALGWVDTGKRDYRPFTTEPLWLLEWTHSGTPPTPER